MDQKGEEKESGEVVRFPLKRRLSNLRNNVPASGKLKPVLIEQIVNEEERKADQRATLHKKIIRTNPQKNSIPLYEQCNNLCNQHSTLSNW